MKLTPQRKKELLLGAGALGGLLALLYLRGKSSTAATDTAAVGPLFDPSLDGAAASDGSAFVDPYSLPPDSLTGVAAPVTDPTQPSAASDTSVMAAAIVPTSTVQTTQAVAAAPAPATPAKPTGNDRPVVAETAGNVGAIARGDVIAAPPPEPLYYPVVTVSSSVNDTGAGGGQAKPTSAVAKKTITVKKAPPLPAGIHRPGAQL